MWVFFEHSIIWALGFEVSINFGPGFLVHGFADKWFRAYVGVTKFNGHHFIKPKSYISGSFLQGRLRDRIKGVNPLQNNISNRSKA